MLALLDSIMSQAHEQRVRDNEHDDFMFFISGIAQNHNTNFKEIFC